MQKKSTMRLLSLLLALILTFSLFPSMVLAAPGAAAQDTIAARPLSGLQSGRQIKTPAGWAGTMDPSSFYKTDNGSFVFTGTKDEALPAELAQFGRPYGINVTKPSGPAVASTYAEDVLDQMADEYLASYAEMLTQPVGAQGFEIGYDDAPSELVEIVVQFTTMPSAALQLYNESRGLRMTKTQAETQARAPHARFNRALSGLGSKITIIGSHTQLFNGVYLKVPANMVETIAALPDVFSVTPNVTYYANSSYGEFTGGGMAESRELFDMGHIHDDLGLTGAGVTVAVLDTGIDYNHPDLEDAYIGGWDCIDDDDDPMETTYEDWLKSGGWPEYDWNSGALYYTEHGTHVSGEIAGRGAADADNATLGLAPEADLLVYRVLGPYGSSQGNSVMTGIEKAVADGAQVMNLSLGADVNLPYDPECIALNNAVVAGVVVCLSAGNAGPAAFTVGTPSVASLPITVAAGENGGYGADGYPDATVTGGGTLEVDVHGWKAGDTFADGEIIAGTGLVRQPDGSYEYVMIPGYGAVSDFAQVGDLTGKIAVVYRGGGVDFTIKRDSAAAKGAGAVVIINNRGPNRLSGTTIQGEDPGNVIPVLTVRQTEGDVLADAYETAGTAYIKLGGYVEGLPADDVTADFSASGPVRGTYQIKPDITAPGVNIMSTLPAFYANADHDDSDYENAYGLLSGTSMSCPHMTGISALMVQKFEDASPQEIKARLMNTARPLTDGVYSVYQVGAGFVQPLAALTGDVWATVDDNIPWLDDDENRELKPATLSSLNFGVIDGPASKELTVALHGETEGLSWRVEYNDYVPNFSAACGANGVTLDLAKRDEDNYTFQMKFDSGARTGVTYEGYLIFSKGGADIIRIPFAGFYKTGGAPYPNGTATVTVQLVDYPLWFYDEDFGEGSIGWQMFLDSTHSTYGSIFDDESLLVYLEEFYDCFSYTLPANATYKNSMRYDTDEDAENIWTVDVPAGAYDWILWGIIYPFESLRLPGDWALVNDFELEADVNHMFIIDEYGQLTFKMIGLNGIHDISEVNPAFKAPRYGKDAVDTIVEPKYTGAIEWTPAPVDKEYYFEYASDTVYKAHVTLTANEGFEFVDGVPVTLANAVISNVVNAGDTLEFDATFPTTAVTTNGKSGIILVDSTGGNWQFGMLFDSAGTSIDRLLNEGLVDLYEDFDFYLPDGLLNDRSKLVNRGYAYEEIPAGTYDWMLLANHNWYGMLAADFDSMEFEDGKIYVFEVVNLNPGVDEVMPEDMGLLVYEFDAHSTGAEAKPEVLGKAGGRGRVTFFGNFLPVPTEVGVFLGNERVTEPWAADLTTTGGYSGQRLYINFPENTTNAPIVYTVKLADGDGWFDDTATVTVADYAIDSGPKATITLTFPQTSENEWMARSVDGVQLLLDSTCSIDWESRSSIAVSSYDNYLPEDVDLFPDQVVPYGGSATIEVDAGVYQALMAFRGDGGYWNARRFTAFEFEAGHHYEFVYPDYYQFQIYDNGVELVAPFRARVTPPAAGKTPQTEVEGLSYTGTITWDPADATFGYDTVYTAHLTLTAKEGFNFSYLNQLDFDLKPIDPVMVTGARATKNGVLEGGSISVDAVFPATIREDGDYAKVIFTMTEGWYEPDGSGIDLGYALMFDSTQKAVAKQYPFPESFDYYIPAGVGTNGKDVMNAPDSQSILMPAGAYDVCLVVFADSANIAFDPRYWHSYEFKAGYTYEFILSGYDEETYERIIDIIVHEPIEITVTAGQGGSVSGGGTYFFEDEVTLTAAPNSGYAFEGWYEDGVKIEGADAEYSFAAETGRSLEARFVSGVVPNVPIFTDGDGNILDSLSSGVMTVTMPYRNDAGVSVNLTMIVAVYAPDGSLAHMGTVARDADALETTIFEVTLLMPQNADGSYASAGYTAAVFLWDSATYIPVLWEYVFP